jgi:hypothetical protein
MTDKEIMELIASDAKQERKALSVIDKKIADTYSEILSESILVKNF